MTKLDGSTNPILTGSFEFRQSIFIGFSISNNAKRVHVILFYHDNIPLECIVHDTSPSEACTQRADHLFGVWWTRLKDTNYSLDSSLPCRMSIGQGLQARASMFFAYELMTSPLFCYVFFAIKYPECSKDLSLGLDSHHRTRLEIDLEGRYGRSTARLRPSVELHYLHGTR